MIELLFGMKKQVSRKSYIVWGASLMLLKYLGEAIMYLQARGLVLTPQQYLNPFLNERYPHFFEGHDWFVPAVAIWSLPFIWIGSGMSVRRAADAGFSPWLGILFFVPGLNYFLFLVLSVLPSNWALSKWEPRKASVPQSKVVFPLVLIATSGAFLGAVTMWFNTNLLQNYGMSLFFGSPLVMGLCLGFILNRRAPLGFAKTSGYVVFTALLIHLLLLVFALEGFICLAMSFPFAAGIAVIGASLGTAIARFGKTSSLSPVVLILALPVMPLVESQTLSPTHRDVVLSTIEIAAPPEQVWPNVVKFSDLPPSQDWLFQLGVAHPLRARIDGEGVGAIRHCEFSTGAFVEPITAWEEPHRLAFDVRYQPQPMKELSIYDRVDAPHLNGYFRSVRGEFRLIPLENGHTRLEGRTWYEMDMQPGWYWQIYGRWFIHKIHLRVLSHIKNLTET